MWGHIKHYGLMVCCLIGPMVGMAEDNTSFAKAYQAPHGFHWYQSTQTPSVMTATQPATATHDPVKEMAALRELVQASLDRAILYPSVENAAHYLTLSNLLMNNASHFSITVQQALLLHPKMSYAIQHPTQSAARKIVLKDREASAIAAVKGIVKSEVRQSHSIFLRMFFENIQPVTRHYGAPWGAY